MKKRIAIIVCIVLLLCASIATTVSLLHRKKPEPETPQKLELNTVFSGKVNQWQKTLGTVKRNIPSSISNEGLNSRYPTYGTSLATPTSNYMVRLSTSVHLEMHKQHPPLQSSRKHIPHQ